MIYTNTDADTAETSIPILILLRYSYGTDTDTQYFTWGGHQLHRLANNFKNDHVNAKSLFDSTSDLYEAKKYTKLYCGFVYSPCI